VNFIGNFSTEDRSNDSKKLGGLRKHCKCTYFFLEYNYEKDFFICDNEEYDLKSKTFTFLNKLDKNVPIILNITSMDLRLMGTLLFNIKKLKFNQVYCLYTEPLRYCKNTDESDRTEFVDRFDLYKRFRGIESVPGFLRANDDNLEEKWIVFLGFDGKRVEQINEKYEFPDVVPVVTLPSYKPGWQNYALQENIDIIKTVDRKPEYIIANSVLSAYDYLEKMKTESPQMYLRVSPLGTKINALGAMLFCLNNQKNIELLYDNPEEAGRISTDSGKTYIFDISEIISADLPE
jgi:hypothetical protein